MRKSLYLMVLLVVMLACHKKDDNDTDNGCGSNGWQPIHIDTAMNNFFFSPGSYWVYINDSTNARDSIYLANVIAGCEPWPVLPASLGYGYNYDYYIMNYLSSHSSGSSGMWGNFFYECIEKGDMMKDYHPASVTWYYGWLLYTTDTSFTVIDSMMVGNNMFHKLIRSADVSDNHSISYTAKGIGVVKVIDNNQEWNLVHWKILR